MAQTANITSLDAITAFRAALIVYFSKVRPLLDETSGEILRMRQWLETDQRRHWETQSRQSGRKLEEARAELFNATLSKLQEASGLHLMAVQRAERAVRECEGKLKIVKLWSRDLEDRAAPFLKQTSQFQSFLAVEMARALAHLDQVIQALEAYASVPTNVKPPASK